MVIFITIISVNFQSLPIQYLFVIKCTHLCSSNLNSSTHLLKDINSPEKCLQRDKGGNFESHKVSKEPYLKWLNQIYTYTLGNNGMLKLSGY